MPLLYQAAKKNESSGDGKRSQEPVHNQGHINIHRALGNTQVQAKLKIGSADDEYEREADRVAEQVVRMQAPPAPEKGISRSDMNVQRKCAACERDEEETVRRKPQNNTTADAASHSASGLVAGSGGPLPKSERAFFESRFGHDFSNVRIHTGDHAAQAAQNINAKAFTYGNNIVFGQGEYRPGSVEGNRLMAHELTHVIQQSSGLNPGIIQRSPTVESVEDCNPAGFTNLHETGVIGTPEGEVAYTVDGRPGRSKKGVMGRDENNKIIIFSQGTTLRLGKGDENWTPVCLKIPNREKSEVHWVRTRGFAQSAGEPKQAPSAADQGETWSGNFSDLSGKTGDEVAVILRTLLIPELIMVRAEAEARSSTEIKTQADAVFNEHIAEGSNVSHYPAFMSAVEQGNWRDAVSTLMLVDSPEQVSLFVAQLDSSSREQINGQLAVHGSAGGIAHVIEGLTTYEYLIIDATRLVESEVNAKIYRDNFGRNWGEAAKALSKFSDETIFLELRLVNNNDHLRALRKAADRHGYARVSMIVSAIIAAQDKTGIYLESLTDLALHTSMSGKPVAAQVGELTGLINNSWSENFANGLVDGGLDTALGDAWENVRSEFSSAENLAGFIAGYYPGLIVGIAKDLWGNISGIALIAAKLAEYNIRFQYEPMVVLKEIYQVLEGLAKAFLSVLDAREFGYTVARLLSQKIKSDFVDQTPFNKGMAVGEIVGIIITEIALLFIGVGEVTAAIKAVRGTKLVVEIEKVLASSAKLQKFMGTVADVRVAKLLKAEAGLAKGAALLKSADVARDIGKAEEILVDLAKLEKAGDGALIAKKMEPIEYAVLTEKVKNPNNIRLPQKPYHQKYTMEVKVGEHTYRRRPDGSWCRFSLTTCNHLIDDGLGSGFRVIENRELPDIGNGVKQTGRDRLKKRMESGHDGFQLPSWVTNTPLNWNAHHVIPWEFLDHGVFNVLRGKGLVWDHNAMKNAIALPTKKGVPGAENLPIHQARGKGVQGHPVYNGKVQQRLDDILEKFELDPPRLQSEVEKLLADLKGEIEMGGWAGVPQF